MSAPSRPSAPRAPSRAGVATAAVVYLAVIAASIVLGNRLAEGDADLLHLRSQNCRGPWFEPMSAYVLAGSGLAAGLVATGVAVWALRSARRSAWTSVQRRAAVVALVLGALVTVYFAFWLVGVATDPWHPWKCP